MNVYAPLPITASSLSGSNSTIFVTQQPDDDAVSVASSHPRLDVTAKRHDQHNPELQQTVGPFSQDARRNSQSFAAGELSRMKCI